MSFAIELSTEISHRTDFSILCNARSYLDAVEVGVDQGVFAADFLRRFRGNWLIGIDPYAPFDDFPFDRTADLMVAVQALAEFHGRVRLVKARSPDCAEWVRTFVTPEFVYVDGSHDEGDVMADLVGWWDGLPDHGMIAGHDWDDCPAHAGVKAAVERFARERGLVVRITHEAAPIPASWYIYKREPETLIRKFFLDGSEPNPHCRPG